MAASEHCLDDCVPITPEATAALCEAVAEPLTVLRELPPSPAVEEALRDVHELYAYHSGTRLRALRFARAPYERRTCGAPLVYSNAARGLGHEREGFMTAQARDRTAGARVAVAPSRALASPSPTGRRSPLVCGCLHRSRRRRRSHGTFVAR